MTIAIAIPIPYAADNRPDDPNPITIAIVQTMSPQFTCGT
jgi:hypothetical protein